MWGAIVGDIVGSYFEAFPTKSTDFALFDTARRFTDDTVLTIAVAEWLQQGGELAAIFHQYFERFPQAGYGGRFIQWALDKRTEPYNSWGNGSAMRVAAIPHAANSLNDALALAERSASVTHNHPEGIRGAQAVAGAAYLAKSGEEKNSIREFIAGLGYDLNFTLDEIRPQYAFDVSCSGSVPPSIVAFLESENLEEAIRLAISLGGDADTMACIAGTIAEHFYGGVPDIILTKARTYLDPDLAAVVDQFLDATSCRTENVK